jgi:hypothetical protein
VDAVERNDEWNVHAGGIRNFVCAHNGD